MNRSIGWIGVAVVLAGIGLVAFPLVVTGREFLDDEQILGFLVAPLGLFVVLIAAVSVDPRRTTVTGAFGNPDEPASPAASTPAGAPRPRPRSPIEPVHCRYCRSVITADLSQCPRCARARDCRPCGRPLGLVLDRPTCPTCALAEPYCHCPALSRPAPARVGRRAGGPA
jgi:hypothetical protein